MIEKIILDHLSNRLDVPVYMERPQSPPAKFVLIEKTGSSKVNKIESATIVCQAYADTLEHSAILNEKVKEAMESATSLSHIYEVSLNSDYYFPNTNKHEYRYQSAWGLVFN